MHREYILDCRRTKRRSQRAQGLQSRLRMGQELSSPIDDSIPTQTLEDRSVDSVAKYIKEGHAKKIVIMVSFSIFLDMS